MFENMTRNTRTREISKKASVLERVVRFEYLSTRLMSRIEPSI